MKSYQQHLSALESTRLYIERGDEFGFTPDMLDELDRTAQEMLETIKELEKQTRKTGNLVYKKRKKDRKDFPITQEDSVAIGCLDVDGEIIFNEINSELYNTNDRFSRKFYIKQGKEFVPFYPKSLVLEVVYYQQYQSEDELCVVGYVVDNQVVYYDQIMQ